MHGRPSYQLAILLICQAALITVAAEAQSADQRAELARWEAQLDGLTDQRQLTSLMLAPVDSTRRDKTSRMLAILRRGFVRYRLGTVSGQRHYYDEALEDFWSVILEKYRWPQAWYGLGLTKVAMAGEALLPYTATHQPQGSTYAEEAREALRRALEHDKQFTAAAVALARLEREDAIRPARDSAVTLLDRARELFLAGDAKAAAAAYHDAALRASTPESRARFRRDLAWIADSSELEGFDATTLKTLPAWLDAFWERRDVRDVRAPGERIVEHYRRLAYAEAHFTRLGSNTANLHREQLDRKDRTLDDRAVIYIRHGEPNRRASFGSAFGSADQVAPQEHDINGPESRYPTARPPDGQEPVPPNLSWKYQRAGGDLIFHFVAHEGSDYRLIESLLDVFSVDTVVQLQMGRQQTNGEAAGSQFEWARFARPLIASRAGLDPLYARLENSLTIQGSGNLQRERATGQHSIEIGTSTDTDYDVFERALDPSIQAYGVTRGDDGKVLLVIGVAGARLAGTTARVRVVVSTRDDRRLTQVDTLLPITSFGPEGAKAGVLELPAPGGVHRVRALVTDEARVAAGDATIDSVTVPAAGGALTLSDLILGERGGVSWPGPDGEVWLNGKGTFAPGVTAQLFYQAAGLTAGAAYQTRIELRRAGDDRQIRSTTSEFVVVAASARQSERRELSLAGLGKGDYVLHLTLSGPGGSVTRTRALRLR